MMQTIAVLYTYGKLAWLEFNNYRQDYSAPEKIQNSLAARGWVSDNPVPGVKDPNSAGAFTESQLRDYMERLKNEWDRLKEILVINDTPENQAELHVFQTLHCETINNQLELIVPEVSMNAGFRRARSYRASQVQRYLNAAKVQNAETDIKTLIPVRIAFYKNNAARIIDQQLENEMQGVGTKKMEDLEKLSVTKALFDESCLESEIRRLYSSSTGQKTFGICQADANWPKLRIYDRFMLKSDDATGHKLPWGPFRGADLVKLNNRFHRMEKIKKGLPLSNDEKAMPDITDDEAAEWFRTVAVKHFTEGAATKIMNKSDMEGKAKSHKLLAARDMFQAVLYNSEAHLKPLTDHADALNGIYELVKSGKGDVADKIVKSLSTDADLFAEISDLISAGRGEELKAAIAVIKSTPKPTPTVTAPTVTEPVKDVAPVTPPTPAPVNETAQKKGKKETVGAK